MRKQANEMTTKLGDHPLVSVVMPVYNHRDYVIEAIESVYAQTYRPIEIIIIDDGSSDGSAEAVAAFIKASAPPEGIRVRFHRRKNCGAHITINEGLEQAAGKYLTILNSDDLYARERLELCVQTAQLSRARLVFTYVEPVGPSGEPLKLNHPWHQWYNALVMDELARAPSLSFLLLGNNIAVSSGNLFFHRSLLTEIGSFRDYKFAHDVDFVLRACRLQEPALIRQKLYRYRIHSGNTISNTLAETEEEYQKIACDYLVSTLDGVPNRLAPSFETWPNSLYNVGGAVVSRLIKGLDAYIKGATPAVSIDSDLSPPAPIAVRQRSSIVLASHEMSYSGAPVLLLEIAKTLKYAGVGVEALTLRDGPLVSEFRAAGISVAIMAPFITMWEAAGLRRVIAKAVGTALIFWSSLVRAPQRRSLNQPAEARSISLHSLVTRTQKFLGRPRRWRKKGLARWRLLAKLHSGKVQAIVFGPYSVLSEWLLRAIFWGHPALKNSSRPLLLNSFASYPLAFQILQIWKGPVFWYIHETYDPQILLRTELARNYFDSILKKANVSLLFGSNATREVWAREGYDGHVRYWSGLAASVADKRARGRHSNKRVILSVGTSGPRKGTRALIEAFALGCTRGIIPAEAELVIVGVQLPSIDPYSRDFVLRALSPDLRGRVRLVAMIEPEATQSYYAEAEIYVQASTMECLPLALLTAMAYGLSIVTTDADGCKEAIVDGVCGLVVPPRQIEVMAEAIGQLFESQEKAGEFGHAARRRFQEKFSLEVTVGPLMELLLPSEDFPGTAQATDFLIAPPLARLKTASLAAEPIILTGGGEADHQ